MKKSILSRKYRVVTLLLMLLSVIFTFPLRGFAEEGTLNFYVTPEFPDSQVEGSGGYFDLNLSPGTSEKLTLELQNAIDEPIVVAITTHTAYTNVNGVVEYGKNAEEPDSSLTHSIAELIETPETIELDGNETRKITLTLNMPEEEFGGFLAGGLRLSEVKEEADEEESEGEGLAIKNEFAYVVGVVASNSRDTIQADLDLLDVFPDQLNYRNVISATIQNFTSTFVNWLEVDASVQRKGEEKILYETSKEQMQMAPNSHFNFPISLNGDRFQSGDYVLNLTARSGEEEWSWTEEFTIEADEARSLNRQDVTIDSSPNWLLIGSVISIVCLLAIITYLVVQNRKNKQSQSKEE
ncbi:cell surface protein [Enterococcus casseliflavus]|nr:cell surface protein [Enterococcus casseliflavus]